MKQFKAHPLMILKLIKPFLFILIIPFIKGLIQYIIFKQISGILSLELIAVVFILIIGFLRLQSFKLRIYENSIEISQGFIIKKTSSINKEKLSSVVSLKNPIDTLFKTVTFRINTETGRLGKPDFEFKLSAKEAEILSDLLYEKENRKAVRFSLKKLALSAALSSSAITGLVLGVPIIDRIGKLLGVALSEMLLSEINKTANRINTYFPPIFNIITLIFLIGYFISFIYSLLSTLKFRINIGKKRIEIKYGILIRKKILFSKSSINNICIDQTPLMRLTGYYMMRAAVGGFGGEKKEKALLIPTGHRKDIEYRFKEDFDYLLPKGRILRAERSRKMLWRFYRIPLYLVLLTVALSIISSLIFPLFERLIYFLSIVALVAIFYYAGLCRYNYRYGCLQLDENICACGTNFVNTREMYFNYKKTGVIKITRNPIDCKKNTCKVKFIIRSESADNVKVKHLNYDLLCDNLSECF